MTSSKHNREHCISNNAGAVPVSCLWIDADEAGTLLEALWAEAFDQFQLLSVEKRPVLFSPLHYASCPARIQTCNMSTKSIAPMVYNIQWTFDIQKYSISPDFPFDVFFI